MRALDDFGRIAESSGICFAIHTFRAVPQLSLVHFVLCAVLVVQFLLTLRRMQRTAQLAYAGVRKSGVLSFSVYSSILNWSAAWVLMWIMAKLFAMPPAMDAFEEPPNDHNDTGIPLTYRITYGLVVGATSVVTVIFEVGVTLMLLSASLGRAALKQTLTVGSILGLLYGITLCIIYTLWPGEVWSCDKGTFQGPGASTAHSQMRALIVTLSMWSGFYTCIALLSRFHKGTRETLFPFTAMLAFTYCLQTVAFTLINEHLDAGICLRDFACLVYFVCWSPCLYRTLQLDSDYWTEQIEKHIAASLSGSTISSIRSEISPEDDAVALDAETRMAIRTHVLREASLLISPVELVEQSVLSRDFFVTIALCSYQRQDVIVKWFTLNRFTADALGDVLREARILQRVRHQNTVEFIGISCDLPRVGLVMENLANGDLFQALSEKRVDWSKTTPLKMALEICAGLLYLHQRDMVHGDVKSKNVFLDDNWNCKVADFGESMLLDMAGNNDTVRGTGAWVAPELFASPQCLSFHSDVYSFGVLLWELFTWRYPFVFVSSLVSPKKRGKENNAGENNAGAANETEAAAELLPRRQVTPRELSNAVTAERLVSDEGRMLPMPRDLPRQLRRLLRRCLARQPEDRPTMLEIMATLRLVEADDVQWPCRDFCVDDDGRDCHLDDMTLEAQDCTATASQSTT